MIGFFGGSFDPIHFGHISLAVYMLEEHQLEKIIFCPAFCSPFKISSPPLVSAKRRLEMVKLALDHPQFEVTSIEIDRSGSSYTIDTIRQLNIKGLRLILSDESSAHLDQWKESDALLKLAPPLIGERTLDISSTEIRKRLQNHLYCGHLVPAAVLKYIQKHNMYTNT